MITIGLYNCWFYEHYFVDLDDWSSQ